MADKIEMWCTTCGGRFTGKESKGVSCCPKCKATGIPCTPGKDYLIEINWHELRILGIWASNYAHSMKDEGADGSRQCLRGILSRLERQAPMESPLTMGGEIRELRQDLAGKSGSIKTHNIPDEGLAIVNGPGAVGHSKPPSESKSSIKESI